MQRGRPDGNPTFRMMAAHDSLPAGQMAESASDGACRAYFKFPGKQETRVPDGLELGTRLNIPRKRGKSDLTPSIGGSAQVCSFSANNGIGSSMNQQGKRDQTRLSLNVKPRAEAGDAWQPAAAVCVIHCHPS
ncbi:hypothetical protein E4U55_005602 [Claviceps digitariae]|nr:hypothetical protein E4U55_005602 [Claviceps digitariae]